MFILNEILFQLLPISYTFVFCSLSCMSIPLVMRHLLKKSKTCRPEQVVPMVTSTTKRLLSQSKMPHKPLKLVMPTIAQMQANHSLMSPQLTNSPSAFLTGLTPGSSMFLTPGDHPSVGGLKRKRSPSTTMTAPSGTPTDGSRTPSKLKLPKITLKRKRTEASEFYEIDKTKSEIDTVDQTTTVTTTTSNLHDDNHSIDSLSFVYPQFQNDAVLKRSNSVFSDGVTFPELAGIPLDSDADLDNLLGIPHEPFVQNDASASHIGLFIQNICTTCREGNVVGNWTTFIDIYLFLNNQVMTIRL